MIENIGVCGGRGTTLCRMAAKKNVLDISRVGKHIHTLINGRAVMVSKSDKDLSEHTVPVIATMLASICGKCKELKYAVVDKKTAPVMDQLLKYIQSNPTMAEVYVLQIHPDEMQENSPREASINTNKFGEYETHVVNVKENIENIKRLADGLLRTHIAKDMWGSKQVVDVFSDMKASLRNFEEETEIFDRCVEQSSPHLRFVQASLAINRSGENVRTVAGKIVEDFSRLKTYQSVLAQDLHNLYTIDGTFKKATGYPASWFMISSSLMDFAYEYDTLINNLVKTASIEAQIIEPLLVWKIRTIGIGA